MSLVTKIRLGFGVPILVSALIGILSYRTASQIPQASTWVEHAHDVVTKLRETTASITELVTIQRNSLQAGETQADWARHSKTVEAHFVGLRTLLHDSPGQLSRADELRALVFRWDNIIRSAIDLRKTKGLAAAVEWLKNDDVKKLGERVKTLLRELDDEENRELNRRHAHATQRAEFAMYLIGGGTLLVVILGIAAAGWIAMRVTGPVRQLVKAANHIGAGSLEHRISARDNDELGVLAAAFNEMTEKLQTAERDLRAQADELRSQTTILQCVLDRMADGVIVADEKMRFLLFNAAAEQMLGSGAIEAGPDEWAKLYGVHDANGVLLETKQLPLVRALGGEVVDGLELYVKNERAPQGTWISLNGRPLRAEDGHVWGAVVVIRNITGKKGAEHALKAAKENAETANRAKNEFLSRMSHELRTPLNSILGFAQVLEMSDFNSRSRDCLDHILKGGRHLLGLIDEVLDISRIETGNLTLSGEAVDVSDAIGQAMEMVKPIAATYGVQLIRETSSSGLYVMADRRRLQQVLLNLLSNGIKYNRCEGSVRVSAEPTTRGSVRIQVVDSGIGISSQDQARLFVPFERLGAMQTNIQGTGLGLALTKRLVEAMNGEIGVDSTVGAGSSFWVELAAAEPPQDLVNSGNDRSAQQTDAPGTVTKTILYIEDNVSNVKLMENILAFRPHVKLVVAMLGSLGLELANEHHPDLIFLDLHLPDVTGDVILRRLRAEARTKEIPTVVISADATPREAARLRDLGATDYITKPLDVEKLLQLLDRQLADSREPALLQS